MDGCVSRPRPSIRSLSGAMLIMLAPLSVYLAAKTRKRLWWVLCALITLGALASISRTTIMMGATIVAVFFFLNAARRRCGSGR